MSIRNNSVKLAQAAELNARIEAYLTSGGRVQHSRAKGGPVNKYANKDFVAYSQREAVIKQKERITWQHAMEQLRALGKLTPNVEALIKAKL
jgi:hypothetical protein